MKLRVLAVGRVKGPLKGAVDEYAARVSRYWKLEVDELSEGDGPDPSSVMAAEMKAILGRVDDDTVVWALTRKGKGITSTGLASYLESLAVSSAPGIIFVLGGAYGLHDGVLAQADRMLSLSPMTLPHDLARLVLLEQLYRAGTIRRNEPYHKGS